MSEMELIEVDNQDPAIAVEMGPAKISAPPMKTMFNYFKKLPTKSVPDTTTVAPAFNKQHVMNFKVELFDDLMKNDSVSETNYILCIRSKQYTPKRIRRKRNPLRSKLFQFHEDVRPPYFGTWQKESIRVTGRRPYRRDEKFFDYDCDSEAEWDIGGPGESLRDSEEEEDVENEYEIDMKTFVPHGYVSDDEVDEKTNPQPLQLLQQHKPVVTPNTLGIFYENPPEILRQFKGVACS